MKSTKPTKPVTKSEQHVLGTSFFALIAIFFVLYFVVYMTPSRQNWYIEMRNRLTDYYQELTHIGS